MRALSKHAQDGPRSRTESKGAFIGKAKQTRTRGSEDLKSLLCNEMMHGNNYVVQLSKPWYQLRSPLVRLVRRT